MISIRNFFSPKTLDPKSFQKRSIIWSDGLTGVENSLPVWMKYDKSWFLVQKRMWISLLCFAQNFMTMCSNCLFKPKVLIHLQVVRGRVRLLVESNFESVSKAGVRGMGQVVLGRSSSLFVPGTSEDGNDFFIFRWNVDGRFSKFWDEDRTRTPWPKVPFNSGDIKFWGKCSGLETHQEIFVHQKFADTDYFIAQKLMWNPVFLWKDWKADKILICKVYAAYSMQDSLLF